MGIVNLMFQKANLFRPTYPSDTSGGEAMAYPATPTYANLPVCIQPASGSDVFRMQQQGMELTHVIYTSSTSKAYHKNDKLVYRNRNFFVRGVRNLIELDRVIALDCVEYEGTLRPG